MQIPCSALNWVPALIGGINAWCESLHTCVIVCCIVGCHPTKLREQIRHNDMIYREKIPFLANHIVRRLHGQCVPYLLHYGPLLSAQRQVDQILEPSAGETRRRQQCNGQ